jgi:hypothetical protein
VVLLAVWVFLQPSRTTIPANATQLSNQSDPYANLGTASFALIAPHGVIDNNTRFASLAGNTYDFLYANYSNATSVEKSQFVVVVANKSEPGYLQIAGMALNASTISYALNETHGIMMSRSNVWTGNQTVFLLIGYNGSALSAALLSFFVKAPVYVPRQVAGRFIAFNGTYKGTNDSARASVKDPTLDAVLDGTYELGPHDSALPYPYSYYDNFAYLVYYAPVITSAVPGILGNSSGTNLPMFASVCIPPPPPPEGGASVCVGDYVAMPMLQIGSAPPQRPEWSYDTGDCDFLGIDDCIDAEGYAASGLNPQLPYREIPSVYFGFTGTGSDIPPSMTGTSGPLDDSDPITWWVYGPGSLGESTGGFQAGISGIMNESETALLFNDSVEMFSAPTSETPLGNFTVYNQTNSSATYSCTNNLCGMRFNYSIYALLTVASSIPARAAVVTPHGYSQAPHNNYSAILEPVTLSTPKVVKTSSTTYYFSYWSVDSELDGNQYHQQFNTSNATFQLIGPTQAQAVYTSRSAPGSITISTVVSGLSGGSGCLPWTSNNCTQSGMPGVNVTLTSPGGQVVYSGVTGASGQETSPSLPGGCYQVNAHERGYILITGPNPVCVNGPSDVLVMMLTPLVYNVSWPPIYPYAGAPINTNIPINLTLFYFSEGYLQHVSGAIVGVKHTGGSLSSPLPQPSNGTLCTRWFNGYDNQTSCGSVAGYSLAKTGSMANATFFWRTPSVSGIYYLNFTSLVAPAGGPYPPLVGFTRGWTYSIPVVVYSGNFMLTIFNLTLSNSTVTAKPGSSFTDTVFAHICQFGFNLGANATLSCITPRAAYLNASGLPAGSAVNFTPNPLVPNSITFNGGSTMSVDLPSSAAIGEYGVNISATVTLPNSTRITKVERLILHVSKNATTGGSNSTNSGTADGAFNITVFYNGTPAAAAQVSAFSPGVQNYNGWYTGSNGEYNTGFIITPGSYEVDATYANITNSTNYLNVSAGKVTYVDIHIWGAGTTNSTNSTSSQNYYSCNLCYRVAIAGNYSCPSSCPTKVSCSYGGFECT